MDFVDIFPTLFFYYTAIILPTVSGCLFERPETPGRTVALEQFKFIKGPFNWYEAGKACNNEKSSEGTYMELAMIMSMVSDSIAMEVIRQSVGSNDAYVWLGGFRTSQTDSFQWLNGSLLESYTNWDYSSTNEGNCLVYVPNSGNSQSFYWAGENCKFSSINGSSISAICQ